MGQNKTSKEPKKSFLESWEDFLDRKIEPGLWGMRHLAILSVLVSLFVSIVWLLLMLVEFTHLVRLLGDIGSSGWKITVIKTSVEVIDAVLMASIFMVFTYGIYELFISEIGLSGKHRGSEKDAEYQKIKGKILKIDDIDHLKSKLGKLILMVLIVKLFSYALSLDINVSGKEAADVMHALDAMLKLGGVLVMIALTLFLSHSSVQINIHRSKEPDRKRDEGPNGPSDF
ncbi:MAG: YqhA family protein [Chromatiales bacterium]|nr:YqhA family protein [Gammaproteobacteria bacterium]